MSRKKKKYKPPKRIITQPPQSVAQVSNQTIENQVLRIVRSEFFAGPLPKPEDLQKYETICPGTAERIIQMAEVQGSHRRSLEQKVIDSDVSNSRRGAWFGFIIGMTAILGGGFLVFFDKSITGSILGGAGIIGLVSVFVYGSAQRRKERLAKYGKNVR